MEENFIDLLNHNFNINQLKRAASIIFLIRDTEMKTKLRNLLYLILKKLHFFKKIRLIILI
jgi:hypothetical protein